MNVTTSLKPNCDHCAKTDLRHRFALAATFFLTLAFFCQPVAVKAQPACGTELGLDFGHPQLGQSEWRDLAHALLRVENGTSNGTGHGTAFLIDNKRGIYLTAAHVVEVIEAGEMSANGRAPLAGRNPMLARDPLPLRVLAKVMTEAPQGQLHPLHEDFAVLQLIDPTPVTSITPFELAFERPGRSTGFRFYGYGLSNSQDLTPRASAVPQNFDPHSPAPLYRLAGEVREGDSGAPVFDDKGIVYGIVMGAQGHNFALFHPLQLYLEHLFALQPPPGDDRLDTTAFAEQSLEQRRSSLTLMLDARPRSNRITNIALVNFIAELDRTGRLLEIPAELIDCPLYYAVSERMITQHALPLLNHRVRIKYTNLSPAMTVQQALRQAQILEQSGEIAEASAYFTVAAEAASAQVAAIASRPTGQKALFASIGRAKASTDSTTGWLASDGAGTPVEYLTLLEDTMSSLNVPAGTPNLAIAQLDSRRLTGYGSDSFAVSLHDYSLALAGQARMAQQLQLNEFDSTASAALRAATLSAAVAHNPNWQTRALDTLATNALTFDQPDLASRAFAELWARGIKNKAVQQGFENSTALAPASPNRSLTIRQATGLRPIDMLGLSSGRVALERPGGS
ncbi:S1 family peptidase [Pannonibacter sp. Q-1]